MLSQIKKKDNLTTIAQALYGKKILSGDLSWNENKNKVFSALGVSSLTYLWSMHPSGNEKALRSRFLSEEYEFRGIERYYSVVGALCITD